MCRFTLFLLLTALAFASTIPNKSFFNEYLKNHKKQYNHAEFDFRFSVFAENLAKIDIWNAQGLNVTFGINEFTDRTLEEMNAMLPTLPARDQMNHIDAPALNGIEPSNGVIFDWAGSGYMNRVQHQQDCGSCWSFSASAVLETSFAWQCHDSLRKLSEQFLVDCDENDKGCDGGWPSRAWGYVSSRGGQPTGGAYPYVAVKQSCKDVTPLYDNVENFAYSFGRYTNAQIAEYIRTFGPVSCALHVNDKFQSYAGGIDAGSCCDATTPNHAMVISGYGSDNGVNYWIIRNSWGVNWGIGGYYRLQWGYCNITPYLEAPQPRC